MTDKLYAPSETLFTLFSGTIEYSFDLVDCETETVMRLALMNGTAAEQEEAKNRIRRMDLFGDTGHYSISDDMFVAQYGHVLGVFKIMSLRQYRREALNSKKKRDQFEKDFQKTKRRNRNMFIEPE